MENNSSESENKDEIKNSVRQPKKKLFVSSSQHFTIAVYAVITFTACLIIYKFLNNWQGAKASISGILGTLSPFLIAFLIAYFINPISLMIDSYLAKKIHLKNDDKAHTFLSLILSYILFVGMIVLIIAFVIPQIVESLMELIRQFSTIYNSINSGMESLSTLFPNTDFEYIQSLIDKNIPTLVASIQSTMSDIVPMIYEASISIISWVVNILLAFVISCYIMSNKKSMKHDLKRVIYSLFSQDTSYRIIVTVKECNDIFSQYIIGKALDSLIIGILCFICMCIFRLPYALLISLIVGLTNMIPYFGPFIGAIPGLIILLIVSPMNALIFLILILALQQLDGAIIGPKILGNSIGIQPIWIIFAIIAGGAIGGWVGMFVGVPIVAVIVFLGNNLLDYFLYKKNILPDLSNVEIPDINKENVFIPKEFMDKGFSRKSKKKQQK